MLLAALALAAPGMMAAPPDIGFDRAMADRQCATEVKADDLDGRIECLDDQWRGRRVWVLFAAGGDDKVKAEMRRCSQRWTADGVTDWEMASTCLAEAGEPLASMHDKRDFDEKGLRALCSEPVEGLPAPPSIEGRNPVEECLFDNAVDYRIFHLLENAYRGPLGKSFAHCRSEWTEKGVTNWRLAELCAQLQIRASERLADWR